jgi:hypothetical protein
MLLFKLQDIQQLAEQNFAAMTMEELAAVCRHVKAVEEEHMSRKHEMDRIILNTDDDDNTSGSSVSCVDDDIQGVGPVFQQQRVILETTELTVSTLSVIWKQ